MCVCKSGEGEEGWWGVAEGERSRERERSRDWERGKGGGIGQPLPFRITTVHCPLFSPASSHRLRVGSVLEQKKPRIQSGKTSKLPSTHLPPGGEGAAAAASPASLALCSDSRTAAAPGKVSGSGARAGRQLVSVLHTLSCAFKPSWSCVFTSCQARCCYGVFTGTKHWCLSAQNGSLLLTLKAIYRHVQ